MTTKVLLDTDIGSDIDDALCLAYLLAQPSCELLGITTVTGQGLARAKLASALCHQAGRDVPVAIGAEHPLLVAQAQPEAPQAAALESWPHGTSFSSETAVELLRTTVRRHPGEVVLLSIGPLTNVALLFATDPEIPSLLKGLVSMAGSYWKGINGGREWNIGIDPHAATIAYRARPPYHRSVGLDVTTQVTLPIAEARHRFRSGLLRPVLDFTEVWFDGRDAITFHDPLAATTIFDDQICSFEAGTVTIEVTDMGDERDVGFSYWSADPGQRVGAPDGSRTPHQVATAVDPQRFFDHFFGVASA